MSLISSLHGLPFQQQCIRLQTWTLVYISISTVITLPQPSRSTCLSTFRDYRPTSLQLRPSDQRLLSVTRLRTVCGCLGFRRDCVSISAEPFWGQHPILLNLPNILLTVFTCRNNSSAELTPCLLPSSVI